MCESHYIDKDYMDDFAGFYARSIRQYPNYCWRVHFFTEEVNEERLLAVLREAKSSVEPGRTPLADRLRSSYRGYIVLRPHPKAFIAKSVLCPPTHGSNRQFRCCRRYETHLAGIRLGLEAIAFQQQDRTHSACATAAAWTALQKAAYDDDLTMPSPREITEAATRYFLSGRPVPNQGLTTQQLCEAVRSFGLAPELYKVDKTPDLCRDLLQSYLHSGIPVIAALSSQPDGQGKGHAVAVVGYEDGTTPEELASSEVPPYDVRMLRAGLVPKGLCVTKFYVHDDRIGPYARVKFKNDTLSKIELTYEWDPAPTVEEWYLRHIIVPVYPKIRLDLRDIMGAVHPIIVAIHTKYQDIGLQEATVQAMLMRGTAFTADMLRFSRSAEQAYTILSERDFPRYVWVVRASKDVRRFLTSSATQPIAGWVASSTALCSTASAGGHMRPRYLTRPSSKRFRSGRASSLPKRLVTG